MITTGILVLIVLLALGLPVAVVIGLLGITLDLLYSNFGFYRIMGELNWTHAREYILIAIPLFILVGEILLRSGIAASAYNAISLWVTWLPGGLMHANIACCAMFAANAGSSVATAATVGTVAVPQIKVRKYNERLFLGSIAAGGTLGIMIPPSINMIVYGFLTDTSIPQLYLAGIIPGLILAGLFMLTILIACLIWPHWGGVTDRATWKMRFETLPDLLPPLFIFLLCVGSIYAGLATPTEAAALGVVGALGAAAWRGRLSWQMLRESIEGTMVTTAMLMLIILTAYFLNFVLAGIGVVDQVNKAVSSLGWSPLQTMLFIIFVYLVMGMFMDTMAMLVLTVPVVTPIVIGLGYDPVWFGIMLMLLCEAGQITPPVGLVMYVVQGIRGSGSLNDVAIGIIPFVLAMLAMIGLLLAFQGMPLYLPSLFYR